MDRVALVVGINAYTYQALNPLKTPAKDAEAIAQLLINHGGFQVKRLPEIVDKEAQKLQVGRKTKLTVGQLEDALVQLFKPSGNSIPDTALFYFAGHGLRKDLGIQEGFLATSDVNPEQGNWGLRLKWLRELLQESPVRQQIIWLDCCYSGELLNFNEADPGTLGKGRDRCFIAASREYELAYEEVAGHHGVLTAALLRGLDPAQQPDGVVTNFTLVDFINQSLRGMPQRPIYANSGSQILLTGRGTETVKATQGGICPYKGLSYFDCNDEDPKYFYGRELLTDQLLEEVREGSFLAVLGASGSGKSSVIRAGLLHQLKLGQKLSGSDRWKIRVIRPGENPLQNLALSFVSPSLPEVERAVQLKKAEELIQAGATGLTNLVEVSANTGRLVLVVDQFEEVFTLCRDEANRLQFFECLLGVLEKTNNKLCLILVMRADFFSKCAEREYAGLVEYIQSHLITVTPMKQEELQKAITEPAKQVDLEVERDLVNQILADVEGPGSLPLLQYTLTELWRQRTVNRLTLTEYIRLGGVKETLQKRANEVYESLVTPEEQLTAKHIFLELTQLGEGTEDTRRQILKQQLINPQQPEALVDRVLRILSNARLIVTNELQPRSENSPNFTVIDIAHEALIRHWSRLQQWVNDSRDALRKQRELEEDARAWQANNQLSDYLLQGIRLTAAEDVIERYTDQLYLSALVREFISASQSEHQRLIREKNERDERELNLIRENLKQEKRARKATQRNLLIAGISVVFLGAIGAIAWDQFVKRQYSEVLALAADGVAKPQLLPAANSLLKEANQLSLSDREEDIQQALSNYRAVLNLTSLLIEQTDIDSTNVYDEAETSLVQLILEKRIPQLRQELEAAREQPSFIGRRISDAPLTDFERQFTPGALRTTYAILRREFGVKADLYDKGQIDTEKEARRMPCELLREIEELWREYTGCGFYSRKTNDPFEDLSCQILQERTVTDIVFEFPYGAAVDRLNACQIAPQDLNY